jgi:hypothetical protein
MGKTEHCSVYVNVQIIWGRQNTVLFMWMYRSYGEDRTLFCLCGCTDNMGKTEHSSVYVDVQIIWGRQNTVLFMWMYRSYGEDRTLFCLCGCTDHMGKTEHSSVYVDVQIIWGRQNTLLFILQLQETGPQFKRRYSLFFLSFTLAHNLSFNNVRIRNFTSDNLNLVVSERDRENKRMNVLHFK